MKYAELVDGEAKTGELKSFLVDGENVAVTIRIPKTCVMRRRTPLRFLASALPRW